MMLAQHGAPLHMYSKTGVLLHVILCTLQELQCPPAATHGSPATSDLSWGQSIQDKGNVAYAALLQPLHSRVLGSQETR
jgi:hypothetical protein